MNVKGILLVLLVVSIWGINFSVTKIGLEELPPILFLAVRFLIVVPFAFFTPFPNTSIFNVIGVGFFLGIVKYFLLDIALKTEAPAGLSSLIMQAQIFFTIGFSILFFKETITKIQVFGVFLSTIGFGFFFLNIGGNITLIGLILVLLSAFSWSISNLIMKNIRGVNLLNFIIWTCLVPPLPLFILSYFIETSDPITVIMNATDNVWWALAFNTYIATLLAFAIWGWLLKTYSAADVTPFALLIPVVGIITSNLLLGESLSFVEKIGGIFIMFGLVFCSLHCKLEKYFRILKPS